MTSFFKVVKMKRPPCTILYRGMRLEAAASAAAAAAAASSATTAAAASAAAAASTAAASAVGGSAGFFGVDECFFEYCYFCSLFCVGVVVCF